MADSPAALWKMAVKDKDQLEEKHLHKMGWSVADDWHYFPKSTNFYLDPENLGSRPLKMMSSIPALLKHRQPVLVLGQAENADQAEVLELLSKYQFPTKLDEPKG